MDVSLTPIAEYQRRALELMLKTLGLSPAPENPAPLAKVLELEQQVAALLYENRSLRRRVAQLERDLHPEEADLDAFEREMESRLARDRERPTG